MKIDNKCPQCGKELNERVRFCPDCGAKVEEVNEEVAATAEATVMPQPAEKNEKGIWHIATSITGWLLGIFLLVALIEKVTGIPLVDDIFRDGKEKRTYYEEACKYIQEGLWFLDVDVDRYDADSVKEIAGTYDIEYDDFKATSDIYTVKVPTIIHFENGSDYKIDLTMHGYKYRKGNDPKGRDHTFMRFWAYEDGSYDQNKLEEERMQVLLRIFDQIEYNYIKTLGEITYEENSKEEEIETYWEWYMLLNWKIDFSKNLQYTEMGYWFRDFFRKHQDDARLMEYGSYTSEYY